MYLQYVTTLSKTYVKLFSSIEETRNRLEKIQHKLENVSGQVEELAQELNDLQPRFAQITAEIETKKETVGQLSTTRASVLANHKNWIPIVKNSKYSWTRYRPNMTMQWEATWEK